jgi:copper transport protein
MRNRGRVVAVSAAVLVGVALPAVALAHAYLIRTFPSASGPPLASSPPKVALTFDEAVEPRFASISVTDSSNPPVQEASAPVARTPGDPDTIFVPLRHLKEGWYLVYWRAISIDGHPVRGAFTFAVGPNPGPAPQFVIPSISETAATPGLLIARWVVFLSMMSAIGLFVLRIAIVRPVAARVPGTRLQPLSVAFAVAAAAGLAALPVYLLVATAQFALRSAFDVGALVPLVRTSAFGRGYLDLEICFALFVAAAAVALWVDRPERPRRSVAELLAGAGAIAAAATVLIIPGLSGHAAQTAPRGLSLTFDWLHLVAGSVWIGGLIGLLILWWSVPAARRVAALAVCVPRFSNVAFVSVIVLLGSGIGATVVRLPILAALWDTSYGKTILAKISLLTVALAIAAVNLLRTKPRLAAARGRVELGASAATLLRRLVGGEVLVVAGAVFAAALLSSLPPPARAFALESHALARVGPGPVARILNAAGYTLELAVSPNRAAVQNSFSLNLSKSGKPVRAAEVLLQFSMLDMEMQQQTYRLDETRPGVYSRSAPALVMVGHWGLGFQVTPQGGKPFTATVVDNATG